MFYKIHFNHIRRHPHKLFKWLSGSIKDLCLCIMHRYASYIYKTFFFLATIFITLIMQDSIGFFFFLLFNTRLSTIYIIPIAHSIFIIYHKKFNIMHMTVSRLTHTRTNTHMCASAYTSFRNSVCY